MHDAVVEVAVRAEAVLGEGPTWDPTTATLIWVDILGSAVHRFDPVAGIDDVVETPQHVGAAKPRAHGGLVLNLRDGIALIDPVGRRTWLVYWERPGFRGSDAAVDPAGRLWAGTVRYDEGGGGWLAVVSPDGAARVVLDGLSISNGIGWSPDTRQMYFIDSPTRRIDVLDYDLVDGAATSRRPLCAVDDTDGVPDGLCVDADGAIWVALNGGSEVRRYTPDGTLDRIVPLPVSQPTACCFGGEGMTDLYVSSARNGLTEEVLAGQPLAGSLLVIPNVGTGLPGTVFDG